MAVHLHRIDPTRNMHRFYSLDVQPDLFGAWMLMRSWGRLGSAGQARGEPYENPADANAALERQRRVKERRGYVRVGQARLRGERAQTSIVERPRRRALLGAPLCWPHFEGLGQGF